MSSLRLPFFPSTAHFRSAATSPPSLFKSLQLDYTLSSSISICNFSSFSQTLHIESRISALFLVHASIDSSKLEESETEREQKGEEDDGSSGTRLLAQNVPWTCTADDLRPVFEKYGSVEKIELSMYNKTRNRGLAFITMGSPEEALLALTNLESYEFDGRALKLAWAKPKKKRPSSPPPVRPMPIHNLFVANLSYNARAKDLKEFFNAENGNVVSAEIIFHENYRGSAGYGFVSFNTKEEAEAAVSAFQGKEFMGRPIRVARKISETRDQKDYPV